MEESIFDLNFWMFFLTSGRGGELAGAARLRAGRLRRRLLRGQSDRERAAWSIRVRVCKAFREHDWPSHRFLGLL